MFRECGIIYHCKLTIIQQYNVLIILYFPHLQHNHILPNNKMKVPNGNLLCLLFAALLVVVHGAKPTGGRRRRRRVSPTPAPRVSPTPAPFVAKPTGTLPTQDMIRHTTRVRYPNYIPNDEDVATIEQIAHYHSIEIVDAIDQFVQVEILADEEDADEEDVDSEYEEDEEEVEEDSEEEVTVVERPPKKTRTCEYSYGILCVWCLNDCALYLIQFCLYLSIYYFHFINTSPRNCFQ